MSPLQAFDPELLPLAALLLFRVGGLMLVAPTFAARGVPAMWRTALTLVLVVLLLPGAAASATDVIRITPAAVAGELLTGFALGFGAAVLVGAAESAGDIIAIQTGLSGASTLDPLGSMNAPVVGHLLKLAAVLLLLLSDAHVVMVAALGESTAVLPVGGALAVSATLSELLQQGALLLALGVRFAAPVVLVVFLTNAALGVLARTAPQLNVFILAYPLQIAAGLFTLGVSLPYVLRLPGGWSGQYRELIDGVLGAIGS